MTVASVTLKSSISRDVIVRLKLSWVPYTPLYSSTSVCDPKPSIRQILLKCIKTSLATSKPKGRTLLDVSEACDSFADLL